MDGLPTVSVGLMIKMLNVGVSTSLTHRVRKGKTCPAGSGREKCFAGLERGKHALVRLGQ